MPFASARVAVVTPSNSGFVDAISVGFGTPTAAFVFMASKPPFAVGLLSMGMLTGGGQGSIGILSQDNQTTERGSTCISNTNCLSLQGYDAASFIYRITGSFITDGVRLTIAAETVNTARDVIVILMSGVTASHLHAGTMTGVINAGFEPDLVFALSGMFDSVFGAVNGTNFNFGYATPTANVGVSARGLASQATMDNAGVASNTKCLSSINMTNDNIQYTWEVNTFTATGYTIQRSSFVNSQGLFFALKFDADVEVLLTGSLGPGNLGALNVPSAFKPELGLTSFVHAVDNWNTYNGANVYGLNTWLFDSNGPTDGTGYFSSSEQDGGATSNNLSSMGSNVAPDVLGLVETGVNTFAADNLTVDSAGFTWNVTGAVIAGLKGIHLSIGNPSAAVNQIFLGATAVSKMYLGSTALAGVYVGADKVFE